MSKKYALEVIQVCIVFSSLYLIAQNDNYVWLQPYATYSYKTIARGKILQMDCDSLGV
jgi:hypothetical protein